MRRSHLLLAGLGLTVVAVTGSAFTAENTIADTVTGYGESAITGAAVTDIDLIPLAADATFLDEVRFTTTTQLDLTAGGHTATLTLKDAVGSMGTFSCNIAAWSGTSHVIDCDTPDTTEFFDVVSVGLTVSD